MATSVFEGVSPLATSPFALLLVQVIIIVLVSRFFAILLRYVNQPRVLAEVLGGIVLGPTVLGRIPGFQDTLFPEESMPTLKAMADLGLVMFLFMVGLELELALLKTTAKAAILVSALGIIIPFAAAMAASTALWFVVGDGIGVSFGVFAAFVAVANSITAFPVLARIVAERKLMSTPVGLTSIAAAALGDVVAWCFLAFVVAISKSSGSPLNVVWVFISTGGLAALMLAFLRPLLTRLLRSGRLEKFTVSQATVVGAFILAFLCAWITEFLGVHAIFGAFLAGLVMPRHAGFAVRLIEKIEDFITIVLLPLYFTYSGLRTQIGALNTGAAWGMVFLVIFVACTKIIGAGGAAKLLRHTNRESLAIGILMNTRGLVELIVLNVGLDAGALNEQVFVIMVIMALVTTFMTSPLVSRVYPTSYIEKHEGKMKAKANMTKHHTMEALHHCFGGREHVVMWLENNDDTTKAIAFLSLFSRPAVSVPDVDETNRRCQLLQTSGAQGSGIHEGAMDVESGVRASDSDGDGSPKLTVAAVRLFEICDRNSSVLRATWIEEERPKDLQVFCTQGRAYGFEPSVYMAVTMPGSHASDLASTASLQSASFLIVPWAEPLRESSFFLLGGGRHEVVMDLLKDCEVGLALFVMPRTNHPLHSSSAGDLCQNTQGSNRYVSTPSDARKLFRMSDSRLDDDDVSVDIGRRLSLVLGGNGGGGGPNMSSILQGGLVGTYRVVVPFIGGHDNRAAVWLAMQLAKGANNTLVHVVHLTLSRDGKPSSTSTSSSSSPHGKKHLELKMDEHISDHDDDSLRDETFLQFVQSLIDGGAGYVSMSLVETVLSLDATLGHLASGSVQRDGTTRDKQGSIGAPTAAGLSVRELGGPEPWPCPVSLFIMPRGCEGCGRFTQGVTAVSMMERSDIGVADSCTVMVPLGTSTQPLDPVVVAALGTMAAMVYAMCAVPQLVVKAAPVSLSRMSSHD